MGLVVLAVALLAPASAALGARQRDAEESSRESARGSGPIPVPVGAFAAAAESGGVARLEARLLVAPAPSGAAAEEGLRVGVLFDLDPGWHLYWRNPGETGLPTSLKLTVDGSELGPVQWPAPTAFSESEGLFTTYGYEGEVLLATRVAMPRSGAGLLRAEAQVLVCEAECIPADFILERPLGPDLLDAHAHADARTDAVAARVSALFDAQAQRRPSAPRALGLALEVRYSQSPLRAGERFTGAIAIHSCAWTDERGCEAYRPATQAAAGVFFFPDLIEAVDLEVTGVRSDPMGTGSFLVEFAGLVHPDAATGERPWVERLGGVLALRAPDGALRHVEVSLPLPRAPAGGAALASGERRLEVVGGAGTGAGTGAGGGGIVGAILLALLGGLVLNCMPCVLPVLAIKIFSIAEMSQVSRRELRKQGAAYAAGILGSMFLLAAVVVALRALGQSVGWGFQFQSPLFVAAICLVVLAFALNLFGVFEIFVNAAALSSLGQEAVGHRRSFFEGLLAVVLATPCSAPFLGTAVGFAFAHDAPVIFAIFLSIGAGLAAPFVLVSWVPAWSKWVPRSGSWMLKLRAGLGFALLGTLVWLLWIFGQSGGVDGVVRLMALLVAVSSSLWIYGLLQRSGRARPALWVGIAAIAFAALGVNVIALRSTASAVAPEEAAERVEDSAWATYDRAALEAALAQGRPALVVFTADWCITCKVNERLVLEREPLRSELERGGFALFKADWTRRDELIRRELARFGKAGVPLYLVYDPESPGQPEILPEILTLDRTLAALRAVSRVEEAASVSVVTFP
ncbi:MAG: thioredoxin family protein [Deltaproteobacteria bacterium]|nr:thioredoxin family protein [Deltaproteobacteria bacterium]